MAIVQDILVQKLLTDLDAHLNKGKVKINGAYVDYSIYKTFKEGNTIRKYLYLETETGYVEEAQLLSSQDEVLAIKPMSIEKHEDGLVVAFEFKINVNEVSK